MAPLNFPNSPGIGSVYTDSTAGLSWQWDGTVWKSYSPSSTSNILILDDISASFNGSTTIFSLTSGGTSITPINAQQLRIVLGGVVQSPGTDYSISVTSIVFSDPPAAGLSFSGVSLGPAVSVTNNVANAYVRQLYTATSGQTNFNFNTGYTSGFLDVYRNGIRLKSGVDYTASGGSLFVLTDAASLNDEIEAVGYAVSSLVTTNGNLTTLTVSGISTFGTSGAVKIDGGGNISAAGIVTATSFVGSGALLTGLPAGYTELDGMLFQ